MFLLKFFWRFSLIWSIFILTSTPVLANRPPQDCSPANCPGQISIVDGALYRDGRRWEMKGVNVSGIVVPIERLDQWFIGPRLRAAHANFGSNLINEIRKFGADTVVLKVSQPALDPESAIYDNDYSKIVADAVRLFRGAGFVVMISMQWQPGSGSNSEIGFPNESTLSAWLSLLKKLPLDDGGMLFDLFNEPQGQGDPATWAAWKNAYGNIVSHIRAAGFRKQVVVVGGLAAAHWLEGAPPIDDPIGKVVYGVHPYFNAKKLGFGNPANWDRYFGNFCKRHACLATEWGLARLPNGINIGCAGNAPLLTKALFRYLWVRHMGIAGWSFDYPDTLMTGKNLGHPTNFDNWKGTCEESQLPFGTGSALSAWFLAHPNEP